MLFCQYDWPSLRQLFLQVMKQVQDNRGLTFENFFKYITSMFIVACLSVYIAYHSNLS
jgi:hypothetical protein